VAEDPYRSPARDEIGAIVSEHRPRALHGVWMGFLLTFCVAILVLLAVTLGRDEDAIDVAKRAGMAVLFLIAAGFLGKSMRDDMTTRVTIGEDGLRHAVRDRVTTVRWGDVREVRLLRQNGRLKSITRLAGGDELALTHALSDFEGVVTALRARGVVPAGTAA
jgi:hypothetical protein